MSLRIKSLVGLLIAALVLGACSTSPTGRSQMLLKSEEELAIQASRQFAEMKATLPLATDRATIDYIACVANALVNELEPPHSELQWEMAVFDEPSVNAFAMPGGKIGVHTGILKAAQNQHQLAAVIGHEIAHVTAQHSNERASRGAFSDVGVKVAAVILGGGNQGATYTAYETLKAGEALGLMLPFSRSQESEADVIGLDYMAKAGFDPREAVPLWQNMARENKGAPAEFLSTHPSSDTRIEQLVSRFPTALPLYNEAKARGLRPNCQRPAVIPGIDEPAQ